MMQNTVDRLKKPRRRINIGAWLMLAPALILLYFISLRPVFVGIIQSFCEMVGYDIVGFAGFNNYKDVVTDILFGQTVSNTVQYVIWSLIIGFPIPIIMAILVDEVVHCKSFFKIALYFPAVVPGILTSLIWYYMYLPDQSGLLNMLFSFFGIGPFPFLQSKMAVIPLIVLSMTWGFGGTMVMYIASLQSVNNQLYEAARIDGAGFFRRIWHVTLPHMSSTILLMFVRQIIAVFQIMEQPMVMTGGGPNNASLTIGLQMYRYAFNDFQIAKSLSLGVIAFVMLMGLTFVYVKLEKKFSD